MNKRIQKSSWVTYFYIILSLFLLAVVAFTYFKVDIFFTERKVDVQEDLLNQQNQQLQASQLMTGFEKLAAARQVEQEYQSIPWSDHITKVIRMLEDVKNVDASESETIVLSDFKVTLDSISLKGKVSKLWLLYYSNEDKRITALLDKFTELNFLEDIHIQNYEKSDEGFEFILDAKVINNVAE